MREEIHSTPTPEIRTAVIRASRAHNVSISMDTTTPSIMLVGEAARYSGLHRERIIQAMNSGALPFVAYEGRRFVRPDAVRAWLETIGLTPMRASR